VPAGRHRIQMYVSRILGRYAFAETWVDVAPGQTVALEYRLPYHQMAGGSLGPPPQRRRGLVAALLSLSVFAFLLCCAGAVTYGVTHPH